MEMLRPRTSYINHFFRSLFIGLPFTIMQVAHMEETPDVRESENLAYAEVDDEIVVTYKAPDHSERASLNKIYDTYYAHRRGGVLYRSGRYKEAFPYLLTAAQRGFKLSQVRLGALYRFGLGGVQRNDYTGLGWLGLAARGETDPETTNLFRSAWSHVPEEIKPVVVSIIDEYEAKYGSEANGVSCDMTRAAGSHISRLTCSFDDERLYADYDDLLTGLEPNMAPNP